jgi:hypothetical protein
MTLEFREENHEYILDGERLPSVSQIIKPLSDYSAVPAALLQQSADYGTATHKMVALYLEGDLDEETLDVGLEGPLKAFKRWQGEHLHLTDPVVERPVYHARLKYAGTPDLVYDGRVVVDVKTRAANKVSDPCQLAAYEELWTANGGTKAKYEHRILELKQNGEYIYTKVNYSQALSMFFTLRDYYRAGQTIEAWKGRK